VQSLVHLHVVANNIDIALQSIYIIARHSTSLCAVTSRDLFLDIAESAHRVAVCLGRDEMANSDR